MTIQDCCAAFGGNYEDIFSRFLSDERIRKYFCKFLQDKSFQALQSALESGLAEDAFRAAHTLKGVAQNLGFGKLSQSCSLITEALRAGDASQAAVLFAQVSADYDLTVRTINEL